MSGKLDAIIAKILGLEGGFVHDPDDPGGATKYGITQRTLAKFWGREVSVEDVESIPEDLAKTIYVSIYFRKPRIDELPESIWPVMLDMSIHHGAGRAVKILQTILTARGICLGPIDGIIGPGTIGAAKKAINVLGAKEIVGDIIDKRVQYFQRICETNPSLCKFLKGWTRRAESYRI